MRAALATTRDTGPRAFAWLREQLEGQLDGPPSAGVLFAATDSSTSIGRVIDEARDYSPRALIAGSTSALVSSIDAGGEAPWLGMLALATEKPGFGSRIATTANVDPGWKSALPFLALADPATADALFEQLAHQAQMAGGGISGADGERFLASSEDLGEGGCALLSFPAGSLLVGTASGITPSGPAYVATSVRGRRILELDGDSPLRKIIAHFNSIGSTANQDTLRAGLYLCDLGDEKGVTGRVITSIDEASGALSLDQEVRPGARVAFGTRDLVGAHRANAGMLQHLASELQGRRPVAGSSSAAPTAPSCSQTKTSRNRRD